MPALFSLLPRRALFNLLAVGCVLPFSVLAFYSHPALDDFAIGHHLRTHTIWQYVAAVYSHSSGRYSASIFSVVLQLFGAHPAAYQTLIEVGFLGFVLSLYVAAASVVRSVNGPAGLAVALGSLLTVAALTNFPWPAEGIFWLTGSIAYLYPVALTGLLAAILSYLYAQPPGRPHRLLWAVALLLSFLIPGFSEITALLLPLVCAGIVGALKPPGLRRGWWGVGSAMLLGSFLTLASPAHFTHWQTLGLGHGLVHLGKALLFASAGTGYIVINWLSNGLLALLALLGLPLATTLVRAAHGQRSLLHRITAQPWLWPVLMLVGVWLSFLFCYVATSLGPALRVKNLLYLYFIVGWLLSVYSWVRCLDARYVVMLSARPVQVGLAGWLAVAFLSDHNVHLTHNNIGRGNNTVVQAYCDWLSGDAAHYDSAQLARYQQVREALPGRRVVLPLLPVKPLTVFYADISCNPALWGNRTYALFYSQRAVWVQPPHEPAP